MAPQAGDIRKGIALFVLVLALAGVVGCPAGPRLSVNPVIVDFGTTSDRETITISNLGSGQLNWTLQEVVFSGKGTGWAAQDVPWLTVDAGETSGTVEVGAQHAFLNVNRQGISEGTYAYSGVQIRSNGGTVVVPVSMTVPAASQPGQPGNTDVTVTPTDMTLHGLGAAPTFTVSNSGKSGAHWYADIALNETNVPAGTPIQIAATPSDATTAAAGSTTVTVTVPDPSGFDGNHLNYTITIKMRTTDAVLGTVNVTVDLIGPPTVSVTPTALDLGTDNYQGSFQVVNVGDLNSLLNFAIFSQANGIYAPYDVAKDGLIASIDAPDGMNGVPVDPNGTLVYAREVSVTISRDGLTKDRESRELWVGAVGSHDNNGLPVMDTQVAPQKVDILVSAAPYVEGATNRSRPPSLMRFVFVLRDKRCIATNAADDVVRSRISFQIQEDTFPLDPDESSFFVSGPEALKSNTVLLLDYTGSMYNAGTRSTVAKLAPGEAVAQMAEAAKQFILDVPATYRIALMEHHDRLQPSRLIHGFDTDKTALIAALDSFSLPVAEYGSSDIYDAIYDAAQRLVQEDPATTLPFDEADVRSVVFVGDGWDTSSTNTLDETTTFAKNSRVRLYPLGFSGNASNPVNSAALIKLASNTGGHFYYATTVSDLARLMDTSSGLTFAKTTYDAAPANTATLHLRNISASSISWYATSSLDWVGISPLSGTIPPLSYDATGNVVEPGVRDVTVTLGSGLAQNAYTGSFDILSDSGNTTVSVQATVGSSGVTQYVLTPYTQDVGRLWGELRGQVVLTYTSLFQSGSHTYHIEATYPDSNGNLTSAFFQKEGVYYAGDPRAGQISLTTAGIDGTSAAVFVRADYVPRNITQFRFRFVPMVPASLTPALTVAQRAALLANIETMFSSSDNVTIVPDGLLAGWRLINEGHGVFLVATEPTNYLRYASFGNLLQVTLSGLDSSEPFTLGFRVDNTLYSSPPQNGNPSLTKYFLYPGGFTNPDGVLTVGQGSNLAAPAKTLDDFATSFDPDAPGAWDRDKDGVLDFDDMAPDDPTIGAFPE